VFNKNIHRYKRASSGWLAGWVHWIEVLRRDRDFRFLAIDFIDFRGSTIKFGPGPLWVPELWGPKIYMSDFNNMNVDLG
jgi:hypothetical protein